MSHVPAVPATTDDLAQQNRRLARALRKSETRRVVERRATDVGMISTIVGLITMLWTHQTAVLPWMDALGNM